MVVWVHGGAFVAGNRSGVEPWAACLAARGMAVAAVEYQWAPEAHWPAQVEQIGQCCRTLGGDSRLDMAGWSLPAIPPGRIWPHNLLSSTQAPPSRRPLGWSPCWRLAR